MLESVIERIDFHSIDADENRARFYRVRKCTTLFGERVLNIQWGRLGTELVRQRDEPFDDDEARDRRFAELRKIREKRGYSVVYAA